MINRFNNLNIWQKILIGIGIIIIFKIFLLHNFITNVKAEEIDSGIPGIVLTDPVSNTPIYTTNLLEKGKYSTNFVSSTVINNLQTIQNCYLGQFKYFSSSNNQLSGWGERQTRLIEGSDYYNIHAEYINGFEFESGTSDHYYIDNFQPNTHYSFMFSILSEDVTYSNQTFNTNDFNFRLFMYDNNYIRTNATSLLNNIKVEYIPGRIVNNNQQFSFISISFDTRNNFYYTELGSMEIDLYNYQQPTGTLENAKWLYKSNGQNSWTGIYQVVMVQDADLQVIATSLLDDFYGFTDGQPLNQQQYETCDTLDIACHVRNIQKGIENFGKNIIYNISNVIQYLFVPNTTMINNKIDELKLVIQNNFPTITSFIDFIQYIIERYDNITPTHTINFSGIKLPGYNTWLIEPFTYNIDNVLQDATILNCYNIAKLIINAIISVGWFYFCFNIVSSILYNTRATFNIEH
jgi:hypothetical protein